MEEEKEGKEDNLEKKLKKSKDIIGEANREQKEDQRGKGRRSLQSLKKISEILRKAEEEEGIAWKKPSGGMVEDQ